MGPFLFEPPHLVNSTYWKLVISGHHSFQSSFHLLQSSGRVVCSLFLFANLSFFLVCKRNFSVYTFQVGWRAWCTQSSTGLTYEQALELFPDDEVICSSMGEHLFRFVVTSLLLVEDYSLSVQSKYKLCINFVSFEMESYHLLSLGWNLWTYEMF